MFLLAPKLSRMLRWTVVKLIQMLMNTNWTCNGHVRRAAGVSVDERAGSHRTFDVSNVETTLSKHRTLLITDLQVQQLLLQRHRRRAVQVHYRQASVNTDRCCCCLHCQTQRHTQVRPRSASSTLSTVQALCNCVSTSAVHSSCVSDGLLLHTDFWHFLSAEFAVRPLPPAAHTLTTIGNQAFPVGTTHVWNGLPYHLNPHRLCLFAAVIWKLASFSTAFIDCFLSWRSSDSTSFPYILIIHPLHHRHSMSGHLAFLVAGRMASNLLLDTRRDKTHLPGSFRHDL